MTVSVNPGARIVSSDRRPSAVPHPPSAMNAVTSTNLPGFPVRRGKVRDCYDLGDRMLLIATDRISTYDCIHPTPVPGKGCILTALSVFWFDLLKEVTPHHFLSARTADLPASLQPFSGMLEGRMLLCRKARVVPVECVVRGYLAGSGWSDYRRTGAVCGHALPAGLQQCGRLEPALFTPATKAESGHDENISFAQAAEAVGADVMDELRTRSLAIYRRAADHAAARGIILADTKFEFGYDDAGRLMLIDEVLTPDSSRFWPADRYAPGRDQESFDKQYVRNHVAGLGWNKQPPAPPLPDDVVAGTLQRYREAYRLLTGRDFAEWKA